VFEVVETDEIYLGGLEEGVSGSQAEQIGFLAVVVEEDGDGMCRIRLQHIPDASACRLHCDGWDGSRGV
jgi:hypothetical protein